MRSCIFMFAVAIAVIAGGCQSSTTPASMAMAGSQHAVVVSGGNGGGTTVFLPSADPANPVMLCSEGTVACPECKAAAIKYFQTGTLDPKCTRTGATRTVLIPGTPNVGHQ